MNVRVVDPAQFQNRLQLRLRNDDRGVGPVALARQRAARLLGSSAADRPGSRNLAGIKDPAIDALIKKVIFAKDRNRRDDEGDRGSASRPPLRRAAVGLGRDPHGALEPVRATGDHAAIRRSAFPTIWWYDEALAARTGTAR